MGNISKLKKKADKLYSLVRRVESADPAGYCICVTCGKRDHYTKMQNGHYIPRNYNSTRYYDKNCHVQCKSCNIFKGGSLDTYALYLINKYGEGILEELNTLKNTRKKFKPWELEERIGAYKVRLEDLCENTPSR